MNMSRFVFRHAVTIGLIVAFWAVTGCSKKESFEKPPIPVKVQTVTAALPAAGLKYSATLIPREQVDLAFKVGGYVEDILKLPGPDGTLRDVQKGDRYALTYVPGAGTTLALNGRPLGTIEGADFAAALFTIWLGTKDPMDASFRLALLGEGAR